MRRAGQAASLTALILCRKLLMTSLRLIPLALALALASAAQAQTAPPNPASERLNLRALAATCAQCHGTDGRAQAGSSVVSLAGLKKDYIVEQMQAFKSGKRPATIMHQLSKGYSDAQIEQVAGYFAAQAAK